MEPSQKKAGNQENEPDAIIKKAIEVLIIEADGIINLIDRIDDNFSEMIEQVCNSIS